MYDSVICVERVVRLLLPPPPQLAGTGVWIRIIGATRVAPAGACNILGELIVNTSELITIDFSSRLWKPPRI